jgi:hypothetical protein
VPDDGPGHVTCLQSLSSHPTDAPARDLLEHEEVGSDLLDDLRWIGPPDESDARSGVVERRAIPG